MEWLTLLWKRNAMRLWYYIFRAIWSGLRSAREGRGHNTTFMAYFTPNRTQLRFQLLSVVVWFQDYIFLLKRQDRLWYQTDLDNSHLMLNTFSTDFPSDTHAGQGLYWVPVTSTDQSEALLRSHDQFWPIISIIHYWPSAISCRYTEKPQRELVTASSRWHRSSWVNDVTNYSKDAKCSNIQIVTN